MSALLLVRANPFDTPRIFTFLSGSTYDRQWAQVLPVALALLVALPLVWMISRELDLFSLDEDTPPGWSASGSSGYGWWCWWSPSSGWWLRTRPAVWSRGDTYAWCRSRC